MTRKDQTYQKHLQRASLIAISLTVRGTFLGIVSTALIKPLNNLVSHLKVTGFACVNYLGSFGVFTININLKTVPGTRTL